MGGRRWGLGRRFDRAGNGFFLWAWLLELLLYVLVVLNR
jgi:hypothetical protein